MTVRHLYFIRHGEYEPSESGGVLTALGREQAALVANAFNGIPVASITSSTLSRAEESAEILGKALRHKRLHSNEILMEMLPTAMPEQHVPLAWRREGRANIDAIIERYFTLSRSVRHEVFVCHGNLIRALLCTIMGVRLSLWWHLPIYHASITRFAVEEGPDGIERKVVSYNETGHIPYARRSGSGLEEQVQVFY